MSQLSLKQPIEGKRKIVSIVFKTTDRMLSRTRKNIEKEEDALHCLLIALSLQKEHTQQVLSPTLTTKRAKNQNQR